MKLIDLYLNEIGQHLPNKNKDDILREIRSTLMDMVEDRNPNPAQEPDEAIVKEVLKEFGSPRNVAKQYGKHNYLIGPQLFPTYLQVLKIVLIIVAGLNLVGVIVTIISQPALETSTFEAILQVIGGLFSSLFTAFGIVTLSFAGIERTTPEEWTFQLEQRWSPEDLKEQEDHEHVNITGLAIEITLSLIFIVLLNFFLDRIGIYYLGESGWVSIPILNENFNQYLPWITAGAVLDIALNLYLIRKGFWDKLAPLFKVLINIFKIAVNFAILTGPAIITLSQTALEGSNLDLSTPAQELTRLMNIGLDVLLGLAIFGLIVDTVKRIYDAYIKGNQAKIEIKS